MKNIRTTWDVDMALGPTGSDWDLEVRAWFRRLADWDNDTFVKENSHALNVDGMPGIRVLRTPGELRIFFTFEEDSITIQLLATRSAILAVLPREPDLAAGIPHFTSRA
jgi:hypothetical protein